ncbi:MAG: 50S ribosomal protein L11 methyltransferase [Alphaproteobacteria bacterium]
MSFKQKIWSAQLTTTPDLAEAFADILGETADAVSVFAPPRTKEAKIEGFYQIRPNPKGLTAQIAILAMLKGIKAPKLHLKEMPKLDWLKKVAEDFPPLSIARWTIHGVQHRHKVLNRRNALQIEATSAFGTGEHPTTRGCLMMLDWMLKRQISMQNMLDMGCGSGILALAFAQATRGRAVAVDLDPQSVAIARSNRSANGLQNHVQIALGNGYQTQLVHRFAPYDLIMSNIFAGPLSHLAHDLKNHLKPGGMVILAGLLNHQANRVLAAHRLQRIYLVKRLVIGEWTILALQHR